MIPDPPCELAPDARKLWDECCLNMSGMRFLAKVDYPLLAIWCVAFAQWVRVSDRIAAIRNGTDKDQLADEAQEAFKTNIAKKLKAGEEISKQDLRTLEWMRDSDAIRMASLQLAAGRLIEQVTSIGRQFGFSPASRIQLASLIKEDKKSKPGDEYFREARM